MRAVTSPRRDQEDGFTLAELLVVILVLGIISVVVLTSVVQAMQRTWRQTGRTP